MPFPVAAAIGAAASLGSAGIQQAGAKGNSRRALRQQKAYTDIATAANMRLADYNQKLNFESIEKGYGVQMKGLREAGLNPALMYGTSGGGGITATPAQGVSTAQEHGETKVNYGEAIGMGIQAASSLALQNAQRENIEADTELKKADTTKTAGAETNKLNQEITNLKQQVKNQEAQEALTKVQTATTELDNQYKSATLETNIAQATTTLETGYANLKTAIANSDIQESAKESIIQSYQLSAIEGALRNELLKAQKSNVISSTAVNEQQIKNMATKILQDWKQLDQGEQKLAIEKFNAEIKANYPGITQVGGKVVNSFIESGFKLLTGDNSMPAEKMK